MITNKKIREKLEEFKLPVYKDEVFEDTTTDYNYFIYTESAIRKQNCRYYQDIQVIWVSEKKSNNNYFEIDIIEAMESLGLRMTKDGEYGTFKKAKTNDFVNALNLTFTRPIEKVKQDASNL